MVGSALMLSFYLSLKKIKVSGYYTKSEPSYYNNIFNLKNVSQSLVINHILLLMYLSTDPMQL